MPHLITELARMVCRHELGTVANQASQAFVRIEGRRVLVAPDPVGRPIAGCPNTGPAIKPCTSTLAVQAGYSTWLRIGGQPVCLDTVTGFTDGTPPGVVTYVVREAGQQWVTERERPSPSARAEARKAPSQPGEP